MKRAGSLMEKIASFENLLEAADRARRGKRSRPDVAAFHFRLESNLLDLRSSLLDESYAPGPYRSFRIRDPKPRLISAAPYRDRVVHHALCQVIEPVLDPCLIHDCYANRVGKGSHRALDRCTWFLRRYAYVLKCDIRKYFPSIDHEILKALLRTRFKCPPTLRLIDKIIDNSNPQEEAEFYFHGDDLFAPSERRRGLPIGNLTSQLFANLYLDGLDHFVMEKLPVGGYLRFMDDFLVFGDSPGALRETRTVLEGYLSRLRLQLHPRKCEIVPGRCGVEFLGWRVFPDHRRLRGPSKIRIRRRLTKLAADYASGLASEAEVVASVASYTGHLRHGDAFGLRINLLGGHPFMALVSNYWEIDP
jgi:retron-type reverse transcriptase